MEKLEELSRLVHSLTEGPTCIDDTIKSSPGGIKELLFQIKNDYGNYKCMILKQETKLQLLQNIRSGSDCSLSDAQSELKEIKAKKSELTEKSEQLKQSLTEIADELPELRETLTEAIVKLDAAMQEATQLAKTLAEKGEEMRNDVDRNIQEKEAAVAEYEAKLKELDQQIGAAEQKLVLIK